MPRFDFEKALRRKIDQHTKLVERKNRRVKDGNGIFDRWENPVVTGSHTPLFWRYDLDPRTNPFLDGAARRQRRVQLGRDGVERQDRAHVPRRGGRPQDRSSRWPRARTASTASASGTTRS